jgi:hypothetical protein
MAFGEAAPTVQNLRRITIIERGTQMAILLTGCGLTAQ